MAGQKGWGKNGPAKPNIRFQNGQSEKTTRSNHKVIDLSGTMYLPQTAE